MTEYVEIIKDGWLWSAVYHTGEGMAIETNHLTRWGARRAANRWVNKCEPETVERITRGGVISMPTDIAPVDIMSALGDDAPNPLPNTAPDDFAIPEKPDRFF